MYHSLSVSLKKKQNVFSLSKLTFLLELTFKSEFKYKELHHMTHLSELETFQNTSTSMTFNRHKL